MGTDYGLDVNVSLLLCMRFWLLVQASTGEMRRMSVCCSRHRNILKTLTVDQVELQRLQPFDACSPHLLGTPDTICLSTYHPSLGPLLKLRYLNLEQP